MTDYPSSRSSKRSWKEREAKKKGQAILALFIIVVLGFAILNGLSKSFSVGKSLSKPRWDGKSPFGLVLSADPLTFAVFNSEPNRIGFFKVDGDLSFFTGKIDLPVAKISDIGAKDFVDLPKLASLVTGSKIDKFAKVEQTIDSVEDAQETFKGFASFVTPLKILTVGVGDSKGTNITRIDAFRLWWQVKSFGVNKVEFKDLSSASEEIVTGEEKKVLGVDTLSIGRSLGDFFENQKVSDEGLEVVIVNASSTQYSAELASSFVTAVGANLVGVERSGNVLEKCIVSSGDTSRYSVNYLAKMFDCDINSAQKGDQNELIILTLGDDFSEFYFE